MKELKLMARDDTLQTVLSEIEDCLAENGCPMKLVTQILIAAEEIYVNIAHYAYGGNEGEARVAMEVGATMPWYRYVGLDGSVIGLDHYGDSAPAAVLFREFGITAEHMAEEAEKVCGR